jgi:hypothetical protein
MGRSVLTMIAVAAFGIALVVPDSVSARASGVSRGSRATAFGSGFHGHPGGASRHSGVSRGTFALRHGGIGRHHGRPGEASRHSGVSSGTFAFRHGGVGRHGRAVGRRDATFDGRRRGVAFGVAGFDFGPEFYGSGDPSCQVQRVQIDDDYGWRVRDVVVCPGGGFSPQTGDPSSPRLRGSPSGPREARPGGRLRRSPPPIEE